MANTAMSAILLQQVSGDIKDFLNTPRNTPYFGENNMQMELAVFLKNSLHYDNVFVEYYVPASCLPKYLWTSNSLYVDIVVEKRKLFVPIELKYKTLAIGGNTITCFGQQVTGNPLANQRAYNDNLYLCWKDVSRLEQIAHAFNGSVAGGFFLFVTNDKLYLRKPVNQHAAYAPFSMYHKRIVNYLSFLNSPAPSGYSPFSIAGTYTCLWQKTGISISDFWYCILEV